MAWHLVLSYFLLFEPWVSIACQNPTQGCVIDYPIPPLSFLYVLFIIIKLIMDSVIGLSNYLIKKHLQAITKPLLLYI